MKLALVDYNSMIVSGVMAQAYATGEISEFLVRHVVLKLILKIRKKFPEHKIVLCVDSKDPWRKSIFPYYKRHRHAAREKSKVDWHVLYRLSEQMVAEFKNYFPYVVLQIEHCEGDDIIGAMCMVQPSTVSGEPVEEIVIVGDDKDFKQLLRINNVKQYSPLAGEMIRTDNPKADLIEHIIRGDRSDGIPNAMSDDDTFATAGKKQKMILSKFMPDWIHKISFGEIPEEFVYYDRNQKLIDMQYIPQPLLDSISQQYSSYGALNTGKLFEYCMQYDLRELSGRIGEF